MVDASKFSNVLWQFSLADLGGSFTQLLGSLQPIGYLFQHFVHTVAVLID
jgi:hypothetical protein